MKRLLLVLFLSCVVVSAQVPRGYVVSLGTVYDLTVGTPTSTTLPLAFNAAGGARSYEYSTSTTSAVAGFGSWTALPSDKIVTGLSAGTQYWVRVRAVNGMNRGPVGNPATGTTSGGGPTTLASDNFNRANETPLSGGGNWVAMGGGVGTMDLVTNHVAPHSFSSDSAALYTGVSSPNDQWSQAAIAGGNGGSGQGCGVTVRGSTSAKTCYRVVLDSTGNYEIGKFVAGTFTSLRTGSVTFSAGAIAKLQIVGTSLTFFYNGSQVSTSITDSSIASGSFGLAYSSSDSSDSQVDDWAGGSP